MNDLHKREIVETTMRQVLEDVLDIFYSEEYPEIPFSSTLETLGADELSKNYPTFVNLSKEQPTTK